MGLEKLNDGEVRDLIKKIGSLKLVAAHQALLGVAGAFRHVAALKNGFFVEIINEAVFLNAELEGQRDEG